MTIEIMESWEEEIKKEIQDLKKRELNYSMAADSDETLALFVEYIKKYDPEGTIVKSIVIEHGELENVSCLTSLSQLESISLERNNINNFECLLTMPNLKFLNLSRNYVGRESIDMLLSRNDIKLVWLDLSRNTVDEYKMGAVAPPTVVEKTCDELMEEVEQQLQKLEKARKRKTFLAENLKSSLWETPLPNGNLESEHSESEHSESEHSESEHSENEEVSTVYHNIQLPLTPKGIASKG